MVDEAFQNLVDELGRLPGIGPKSAQRIAYHILQTDTSAVQRLAEALLDVKSTVHFCPRCFNYASGDFCAVCSDGSRDQTRIAVVAEPRDVSAIERTGVYDGLYHVLGGVISPMDRIGPDQLRIRELMERLGHEPVTEVVLATNPDIEGETTASGGVISPMDRIGPDQLRIRELMERLGHEPVTEVVLATNPDIEGETTASYLARLIKPLGIEVTRLASGLPVGGDLEFADEVTLGRAIEARRAF